MVRVAALALVLLFVVLGLLSIAAVPIGGIAFYAFGVVLAIVAIGVWFVKRRHEPIQTEKL